MSAAVRADQRHSKAHPCPICGGADRDPRGRGRRCHGFTSDGYAHCSREEHAGGLSVAGDSGTYAHRLSGTCACGTQHGTDASVWRDVEAAYDYRDARGTLLFQVVRLEGKHFRQRRPDGNGGWTWQTAGIERVLYRLPELNAAPRDTTVYIVEGEKDVENLRKLGAVATCNPMGADKWGMVRDHAREALRGRHVVVIPDGDAPGRRHAADVLASLDGIAASAQVVPLPVKDASDWIAEGGTLEQLRAMHRPPVEDGEPRAQNAAPCAETGGTTHVEPTKAKWCIVPATEAWIAEALPPRSHLLVDERTGRGAVDKTGVWLFAGQGGAGKSYSTIALGLAVASGGRWLETFATSAPGRALIVAAEDDVEDIRRRVHAIAAAQGDYPTGAIERLHVLPIANRVTSLVTSTGDVYAPSADTTSLCSELAEREPYDLVIVDPYGRIAGVSIDSDNAAAAATIGALAMISTAARGLVLGVTHTSLRARIAAQHGAAEGATGIRGATGQSDYARGVLRLERDASAIWLSLAKANHVAQWEPVPLRRGDHGELSLVNAADLPTPIDKAAAKEAARRERDRLDDEAAREAAAANPGASLRQLRAIVCGARGCGKDRADAAIDRCGQRGGHASSHAQPHVAQAAPRGRGRVAPRGYGGASHADPEDE